MFFLQWGKKFIWLTCIEYCKYILVTAWIWKYNTCFWGTFLYICDTSKWFRMDNIFFDWLATDTLPLPPFFNIIHLHTTPVFGILVHNVKYWLNVLEFSDQIHEIKSRYIYISNKMLLFSSFAFLNELYDTQPYRILKLNTFKMHINMN